MRLKYLRNRNWGGCNIDKYQDKILQFRSESACVEIKLIKNKLSLTFRWDSVKLTYSPFNVKNLKGWLGAINGD